MSEHRETKFHAQLWTLIVLLGLPLLYILSVPPAYYYAAQTGQIRFAEPPWLRRYAYPYIWLHARTPLRKPLAAYLEWWVPIILPTRLEGDPPESD